MNLGVIDRRLAALEERARPRILVTLADYVLWRANKLPIFRAKDSVRPSAAEATKQEFHERIRTDFS